MKELSALLALEKRGQKSILPVWHKLDREAVAKDFPLLVDRVAANTESLIWVVARQIVRSIIPGRNETETLTRFLHNLLEDPFDRVVVRTSLLREQRLLRWVENWGPEIDGDIWGPKRVHDFTCDICMLANFHYEYFHQVTLVLFLPFQVQVFANERVTSDVEALLTQLSDLFLWLDDNRDLHGSVLEFATKRWCERARGRILNFRGLIFAGRRHLLDASQMESLQRFNQVERGTRILTYDRLLDAAASIDKASGVPSNEP